MASERQPKSEKIYGLTDQEQLFDRVSHDRFLQIANDLETTIHQIQISTNNYGEFFFVTTSRMVDDNRYRLTFWGLGFHEYRERWISEEWFWYQSYPYPEVDHMSLTKAEVAELIEQRIQELESYRETNGQSERGKLFDMLADLIDEDGAYSEMDDLHGLFDDFE